MKINKLLIILALSIGMSLGFVVSNLFKEPTKEKVLSTNTKQVSDLPSATPSSVVYADPPVEMSGEMQNISLSKVTKVIDGDTVVLESGETVRYIGIDSPEKNDCFSQEATEANRQIVEGRKVRLEKDVSETDRYQRILRFVYLSALNESFQTGETGLEDLFVNDYLVRQGFAKAYKYPPDVKFSDQFVEAEQEARENNRGLWANCAESSAASPAKQSGSNKSVSKSIEGDRDCGDFKTHSEAQAFFESAGVGDPHRLDSDGDGQACETLP